MLKSTLSETHFFLVSITSGFSLIPLIKEEDGELRVKQDFFRKSHYLDVHIQCLLQSNIKKLNSYEIEGRILKLTNNPLNCEK